MSPVKAAGVRSSTAPWVRLCRPAAMLLACVLAAPGALAQAGAQAVALPNWELNTWGQTPTRVSTAPDATRCGAGGWHFAKHQQGDGDAELTLPNVLAPNRAYRFRVQVTPLSGQGTVDVFFRKTGPHYETTGIRSVRVRAGEAQTVELRGIYDASTLGAVRVGLRDEGLGVCLSRPTLEPLSPDAVGEERPRQRIDSRFFGIHLNRLGVHRGWPGFDPGLVRMWDAGTTWADLQPTRGPIDWARNPHAQRMDLFADHLKHSRTGASLLVTLGMTPPWAAQASTATCAQAHYGPRSCVPPADLEDWRQYVRAVAQRLAGRAFHWELLNEADIPMHWAGQPQQLVEMARVAHEELHRADPRNRLMGPNVTYHGLRLLNDFLRLGGGRYVDAISVHVYLGRTPGFALSKMRNVQELVRSHGLSLAVWNTEAGTACVPEVDCGPAPAGRVRMSGEAALAQAVLGHAAQGVRHLSHYTWEGALTEAGGLPLVQPDFATPTAAGLALERVRRWLVGAEVQWLGGAEERLRRVEISQGARHCVAAWVDAGEVDLPPQAIGAGLAPVETAASDPVRIGSDGRWHIGTVPVLGCRTAPAAR